MDGPQELGERARPPFVATVAAGRGRSGRTVPAEYFRRLYQCEADPWGFADSAYEREKYRATLAALPRGRYRCALELGCSVGVFTDVLARRCGTLLAVDCSPEAVAAARSRCAARPQVAVEVCDLTVAFPAGRYDLVTLCELGYFFGPRDLARTRDRIAAALEAGGDLVLVHWTPLVEGHAQTADEVHELFVTDPRLRRLRSARTERYRLDVLRRSGQRRRAG